MAMPIQFCISISRFGSFRAVQVIEKLFEAPDPSHPGSRFDGRLSGPLIASMADEIIDITRYLKREPASDLPRGTMSLWGADGERSRFALPLWRIIYLAQGERGLIAWSEEGRADRATPFVVLDVAADPARCEVDVSMIPRFEPEESPSLIDFEGDGLVVFLGARGGRIWTLVVDGGAERTEPLSRSAREDILFLAGECAGLLFLRDLADDRPDPDE